MNVESMMVPESYEPGKLQKIVKKQIKKANRKNGLGGRGDSSLNTISEITVLTAISSSQTSLMTLLQSPPLDATTKQPIGSVDKGTWSDNNAAVLAWTANGVRTLAISTYNAISALRTEALIAFLTHGLDPRGKRKGLFSGGGGVSGLFILSALGGGTFGLSNLFGGSSSQVSLWAGLSAV